MPPKVKITKEDIIHAAVDITRKFGAQAVNARTVAAVLNCSTQPIFSNFATMEELHEAVLQRADVLFRQYLLQEAENGKYPVYKANGMAYIRFAKEEKELFKLLFMYDRATAQIPDNTDLFDSMQGMVHQNTGLDQQSAKLFHLEMWVFVHGIATMFATGYLDLDQELISRMMTDAYQGLRKQYGME
jgi:AcrR family transcriptional regulator